MRQPPPISSFPRFPVTGGTILLAIGVTVAYWAKVDISPLLEDGNIRRWQLWRFLSSALPHVNPFHLIFNLYWTWVFGSLIEEVLGHLNTGLIFVLLAVGSGAADYALMEGGIGLSGVGYGLFGMLWVLSRRDDRFEGAVDQNTIVMFVVWFFACIVMTSTGAMAVANVAHGAGAIIGGLLGWAIAGRGAQRPAAISGIAALVLLSIAGATIARPWVNLSKQGYRGEFQLGYNALEGKRFEEAARWFVDVTRMAPADSTGWFNLGIAYGQLGRNAEARHAYERAYQLEPQNKDFRAMWEWYQQVDRSNAATTGSIK